MLELSDRSESPFVNIVNIRGQSIDSTTVYLFLFDVKFVAVQKMNSRHSADIKNSHKKRMQSDKPGVRLARVVPR